VPQLPSRRDRSRDKREWDKFEGPVNTLAPGSPQWIRARVSSLEWMMSGEAVSFERVANIVSELREHDAWMRYPVDAPWGSLDGMMLAVCGRTWDDFRAHFIGRMDALKVAATPKGAPRGAPEGNQNARKHEPEPEENKGGSRHLCSSYTKNTAEHVVARLKREADTDPGKAALLAQVEAGEVTPNRAAVIAGYRKPPRPETQAVNLVRKLDDEAALRRIAEAVATRLLELAGR
jgi:hypothetical protein